MTTVKNKREEVALGVVPPRTSHGVAAAQGLQEEQQEEEQKRD